MIDYKGPYKIEPYVDGIDIHDVNGRKVASIADRDIHDELSPPVIARLLAAAPDLLEACDAYLYCKDVQELSDANRKMREAVCKAKGETNA
jgi:hypothetical protein